MFGTLSSLLERPVIPDVSRFAYTTEIVSPTRSESIRLHLSRKTFVKIDEHLCLYGGEQRVYLARFFPVKFTVKLFNRGVTFMQQSRIPILRISKGNKN